MQEYDEKEWKEVFGDDLWRLLSTTINTVISLRGLEGLLELPIGYLEGLLELFFGYHSDDMRKDLKNLQNSQDYLRGVSKRFQNLVKKEPPKQFIPHEIKRYIREACSDYIFGFSDSMLAMCGVVAEKLLRRGFEEIEEGKTSPYSITKLFDWLQKSNLARKYIDPEVQPHLKNKIEYLDKQRHHEKSLDIKYAVQNEPWATIEIVNKFFKGIKEWKKAKNKKEKN